MRGFLSDVDDKEYVGCKKNMLKTRWCFFSNLKLSDASPYFPTMALIFSKNFPKPQIFECNAEKWANDDKL